jgi:hypothetical protein
LIKNGLKTVAEARADLGNGALCLPCLKEEGGISEKDLGIGGLVRIPRDRGALEVLERFVPVSVLRST